MPAFNRSASILIAAATIALESSERIAREEEVTARESKRFQRVLDVAKTARRAWALCYQSSTVAAVCVNDVTPAVCGRCAAGAPRPTGCNDLVSDDLPVFHSIDSIFIIG